MIFTASEEACINRKRARTEEDDGYRYCQTLRVSQVTAAMNEQVDPNRRSEKQQS